MSHLHEMKTAFEDIEAFISALVREGFKRNQIEQHAKAVRINGYHAEDNFMGHIVIRKQHSGIPSDVGWEIRDGVLVAHVDAYDYSRCHWANATRKYDEAFRVKLVESYNIELAKKALNAKGVKFTETTKDGKTKIIAKFKVPKTKSKIKVHL